MKKFVYIILILAIGALAYYGTKEPSGRLEKNEEDQHAVSGMSEKLAGDYNEAGLTLYVNGSEVEEDEYKPYVSNNLHLMMPLKMLKDKMKCTYIEYVNGSIVIKRNEGVARLVLDSQDAELDGKDVKIADAPIKKDDETFVPIEYIADTLDYTCEYNYDTGRVSLQKVGEDSKLPDA